MFEAYVTNLGLYPERGAGAGEYLKFPTTVEEVQALFSRIGKEAPPTPHKEKAGPSHEER